MPYSPMDASLRRKQLTELKQDSEAYSSKDIYYKGENNLMEVYRIPLKYLVFNPYNHRIATFVKTHERLHGVIDVETDEGSGLIEKFLMRSNIRRNEQTKKDLEIKKQQEPGIVTADGVIISGNRRFMLLKKIAEYNGDPAPYFKAVILDDTMKSNRQEIMKLETIYQSGVDERVEYSPIQRYLQCKEFKSKDVSADEIASMMGEKESTIEKYLEIMELMDAYLEHCGYEGIYMVLDAEQQVERFENMHSYLKRYKSNPPAHCSWVIEDDDIDDLKLIYFDYTRLGGRVPVDEARQIGNPTSSARKKGFFTEEKIWQQFRKKHFETVDEFQKHEQTLDQLRADNPDVDEMVLIQEREEKFKDDVGGKFEGNFNVAKEKIENQADKGEPLKLLERAINSLNAIDVNSDAFIVNSKKVKSLAHSIRKKSELFIKTIEKNIKDVVRR